MQSTARTDEKVSIPLSQLFLAKAWQLLTVSDFETAIKSVNKAIDDAPLRAHLLRGQIYLAKFYHNNNQFDFASRDKAVEDFDKVLALDPEQGDELIQEAKFIIQYTYEILLKVKLLNIEKALPDEDSKNLLKRAVQLNLQKVPKPSFYTHAKCVWRGNMASKKHEYEEAIKEFNAALTHFQDNSLIFARIADCYRSMADRLDVDNPLERKSKIQLLDQAISFFELVTHYPGGTYAFYEVAICFTIQKTYGKAIQAFMKALSEDDVELESIKPRREVAILYLRECQTTRVQCITESKDMNLVSDLRKITSMIYFAPKNAELYLQRALKWHELNRILIAQEDIVVAIWLIHMKMYRSNDQIINLRDQIEELFSAKGDSLRDTNKEEAENYYRAAMFLLGKSTSRLQKKIKGLPAYQPVVQTIKVKSKTSIKKKKKKRSKAAKPPLKNSAHSRFFKNKKAVDSVKASEVKVDANSGVPAVIVASNPDQLQDASRPPIKELQSPQEIKNEVNSAILSILPGDELKAAQVSSAALSILSEDKLKTTQVSQVTLSILSDDELKSPQVSPVALSVNGIFAHSNLKNKLDIQVKPLRKMITPSPNDFFKKVNAPKEIIDKMSLLQKFGAFRIYLVGGWLREAVISDAPPTDVDFAIGCDNAKDVISKAFPEAKIEIIGQFHRVKFQDEEFDIWHSVPLSDKSLTDEDALKQDALLRDLTINTIYMDILKKYYDPTGRAIRDLHHRKLNAVIGNEKSFSEDPIRILKLIKFLAQHNWILPVKMRQAIIVAGKKLLANCKNEPQRINACMHKLFCHGFAKNSFAWLEELKLLTYLFPGLQDVINTQDTQKNYLQKVLESADHKFKKNGLKKPSLKYIYDQIMVVCAAMHKKSNEQLKEIEEANLLFQAMTQPSQSNKSFGYKV